MSKSFLRLLLQRCCLLLLAGFMLLSSQPTRAVTPATFSSQNMDPTPKKRPIPKPSPKLQPEKKPDAKPDTKPGDKTTENTDYLALLYEGNKRQGLFDYFEIRSERLDGFKKWAGVITRSEKSDEELIDNAKKRKRLRTGSSTISIPRGYNPNPVDKRKPIQNKDENQKAEEEGDIPAVCTRFNRVKCRKGKWEKLIKDQMQARKDGVPELEILRAVNIYMNETPYIIDPTNWGVPDYWATTTEFFFKDGDCEDYAISKYVTLSRIGFSKKSMRLVVGQDNNSRVEHAILSVHLGAEEYILDNQVNAVLPQNRIKHFSPVYAINETAWWRFTKRLYN